MGQYYKPILVSKNGYAEVAIPWDFGNGAKLMEHSWIGNDFVNATLACIDGLPKRVAWMGDYAGWEDATLGSFGDGFISSKEEFLAYYDMVNGKNSKYKGNFIHPTAETYCLNAEHTDCFIVNTTKNCYIDMEQYVKDNSNDGWCINPLPLLTSIGNGKGGGDYWGINQEDVGSWAFDEIYMTALCPADMEETQFRFKEKELLF